MPTILCLRDLSLFHLFPSYSENYSHLLVPPLIMKMDNGFVVDGLYLCLHLNVELINFWVCSLSHKSLLFSWTWLVAILAPEMFYFNITKLSCPWYSVLIDFSVVTLVPKILCLERFNSLTRSFYLSLPWLKKDSGFVGWWVIKKLALSFMAEIKIRYFSFYYGPSLDDAR